jgi:XRE family aerobic/anaerobic benzoate catabolism transcriptional regulator
MVIAAGGGLVTSPDTYALLLRHATTVWLKARPDDYWQRVIRQGDRRPIEQHPHARDALRHLVARREPLYTRAHVTVDTAGLSVAQVADKVERAVGRS